MYPRVHIHLRVTDLARSRDFYERFFGAAPVKEKPGYVKFFPDDAPINLALSQREAGGAGRAAVSHLGIQMESTAAVLAALARVKRAGLDARVEMDSNCCHANQDKFWVRDPDGVEWEVYHLNYDLEEAVTSSPFSAPVAEAGHRHAVLVRGAPLPMAGTARCCAE